MAQRVKRMEKARFFGRAIFATKAPVPWKEGNESEDGAWAVSLQSPSYVKQSKAIETAFSVQGPSENCKAAHLVHPYTAVSNSV